MKEVKHHKTFEKHFKKRIKPNKKLVKKFEQKLNLFIKNPQSKQLKNHQLKGQRKSHWSFSITGNIRVVYKIEGNIIRLYDIGTHNQVY